VFAGDACGVGWEFFEDDEEMAWSVFFVERGNGEAQSDSLSSDENLEPCNCALGDVDLVETAIELASSRIASAA